MDSKAIKKIGGAIIASSLFFLMLKSCLFRLQLENAKISPVTDFNPWSGVNTQEVQGSTVDSCRCTFINGKLYLVNIKQRTSFTYTPLKNE